MPNSTYGLDVLAQIGFWRDHDQLSGSIIYQRLRERVLISRRQIDLLTQQYRLLLACAHQPDGAVLSKLVQRYGGLIISLDGLEPEGAQEQLWVVREVLSASILAVAWLPRVNASTLGQLLAPVIEQLQQEHWPVLATLSDKQHVVMAAVQAAWPDAPHQWCQAHYLRNLAEPIYEHDQALLVDLRRDIRKAMRSSLGEVATANAGAFSPSGAEQTGRGSRTAGS